MEESSVIDTTVAQMLHTLGIEESKELSDNIGNFDVQIFKVFDFIPDLVLTIRSYVIKKKFTHHFGNVQKFENGIFFSFHNFFKDTSNNNSSHSLNEELPHVKIIPMNSSQEYTFYKNTHMKHVGILVSIDYLKRFLREDAAKFSDLLTCQNSLVIEEFMSDDILRTINEIVNADNVSLSKFYFKLKAIELLYFLFKRLDKRVQMTFHRLTRTEIQNLYKVRDRLIAQLDNAPPLGELKNIAGMNEIKLRKSFIQVFGMGLYEYFQHIRMQEAARLLREDNLTVSEAGYRLGFTNLSHFSRVFEASIGVKPKKWSMEKSIGS
ncbi:AraC-like DNA-binding protein [Mucilaginibacter gracilis]|uniref:AraC-like DNA-binding protein n=1 Tax=Mucilaginibacter gracilis TaxID=423350 RepID=A0A495J876_9SPHI|nr:AraC family transcriptional regulator [Mucilaginibacter gracilis]RKR84648.1 AraC-like DNA-binding protein [Mucilaginibacter gracilis]